MAKSIVAACKVRPETILDDIDRLMRLARVQDALDPSKATILKDNISWHFPFPGANTTPWQLEGVIRALRGAGFQDQTCVQNKTVVTNAFKGEDLNHYVPIFKEYGIPVLYNFKDEEMKWVVHRPKASMLVLDRIYPEGIRVPDYFFGKNVVHLPTIKCVAGDTEIILADGTVTSIRDLVASQIARSPATVRDQDGSIRVTGKIDLMSMDETGEIRPSVATWFWRTTARGRRILRIRTRTGRVLTATEDHRIWTADGWTALRDLAPGTWLAAARHLRIRGAIQPLPQTNGGMKVPPVRARAGRKYSAAFAQAIIDAYQDGRTATTIAQQANVRRQTVQSIRTSLGLTRAATGNPSTVNTIERGSGRPTPRIARLSVDLLEKEDQAAPHAGEIASFRALASPDLAWDAVRNIEEVPEGDLELFDLTVPETSSFIANGLVVHNCHIYTTTTGAMKNAFGGLLNTKRHYTHSWIHETLVDLLAIQKEIHSGIFAVMDGTTAGNGPGPRTMFPEVKDWMLASADSVAIDALAAKMMGFDPMTIDYIRIAHERGLGCGDLREVELAGDPALDESWGFKVGDNSVSRVGDLFWFGPLRRFQNLFFRTHLVHLFILGSEVYHDYYRWPARDRRIFEGWLEKTAWGKLFQEYARRGAPARAAKEA